MLILEHKNQALFSL